MKLFLYLLLVPSVFLLPEHEFKQNIKASKTLGHGQPPKTTISLVQEAYKFSRKRINKDESRAWFSCHNANKGCSAKAIATVSGDPSKPESYNALSIDIEHSCQDTVIDRKKEEAIRKMKNVIHDNPTGRGVKYIWEEVQV